MSNTKEELAALKKKSARLIDQIKKVHADAQYQKVWQISATHGIHYQGPNYLDELKQLEDCLNRPPSPRNKKQNTKV